MHIKLATRFYTVRYISADLVFDRAFDFAAERFISNVSRNAGCDTGEARGEQLARDNAFCTSGLGLKDNGREKICVSYIP